MDETLHEPASGPPRPISKEKRKLLYGVKLPEPLQTRKSLLKEIWTNNACTKAERLELVESALFSIFEQEQKNNSSDVHRAVLDLHRGVADYNTCDEGTLSGHVVRSFCKWLKKVGDDVGIPSLEIRLEALIAATGRHTSHLEPIAEAFRLRELPSAVKDRVKVLIEDKNFKVALATADVFGLHEDYTVTAFVIPCFLQDKPVLSFLRKSERVMHDFLAFLDSFVGQGEDVVQEMLMPYKDRGIMTCQVSKFLGKRHEKSLNSMATELNADPLIYCPNLAYNRAKKSIKFAAERHFLKGDPYMVFFDCIDGALQDNPRLAKDALRMLVFDIKSMSEAAFWAISYAVPDSNMPAGLPAYIHHHGPNRQDVLKRLQELREVNAGAGASPVELVPGVTVEVVDEWFDCDGRMGLRSLSEFLTHQRILGIDSEWKPLYKALNDEVAVLQVATAKRAFIVDIYVLEEKLNREQWMLFFRALLCDGSAVRIGFDMANDIRAMRTSFPFIESLHSEMHNVYCMLKLVNQLLNRDSSIIQVDIISQPSGGRDEPMQIRRFKLSELCKKILDIDLDKSQQVCNWVKRPLRMEQKKYAAMDAFCLVGIYDTLEAMAREKNVDFYKALEESRIGGEEAEKKKRRKKATKLTETDLRDMFHRLAELADASWKGANEVSVVVDAMLRGLGTNLRRCGVDTLLSDRMEINELAAKDRQRCIVSCGRAHSQLSSRFGKNRCVSVQASEMNSGEQLLYLLNALRILPHGDDLFKRCKECNAASMVRVVPPVMEALYSAHVVCPFEETDFDLDHHIHMIGEWNRTHDLDFQYLVCYEEKEKRTTILCDGGVVDLTNNTVKSPADFAPQNIQIAKLQMTTLNEERDLYHICAGCGKVAWKQNSTTITEMTENGS